MRISDWSSDVCSSDLSARTIRRGRLLRPLADFWQSEIWRHAFGFDDGFVDVRQHFLHGCIIHAAARYLRRHLVFGINFVEGSGFALRLGAQLLSISARFIEKIVRAHV